MDVREAVGRMGKGGAERVNLPCPIIRSAPFLASSNRAPFEATMSHPAISS
jgi:hypothetical protein